MVFFLTLSNHVLQAYTRGYLGTAWVPANYDSGRDVIFNQWLLENHTFGFINLMLAYFLTDDAGRLLAGSWWSVGTSLDRLLILDSRVLQVLENFRAMTLSLHWVCNNLLWGILVKLGLGNDLSVIDWRMWSHLLQDSHLLFIVLCCSLVGLVGVRLHERWCAWFFNNLICVVLHRSGVQRWVRSLKSSAAAHRRCSRCSCSIVAAATVPSQRTRHGIARLHRDWALLFALIHVPADGRARACKLGARFSAH